MIVVFSPKELILLHKRLRLDPRFAAIVFAPCAERNAQVSPIKCFMAPKATPAPKASHKSHTHAHPVPTKGHICFVNTPTWRPPSPAKCPEQLSSSSQHH